MRVVNDFARRSRLHASRHQAQQSLGVAVTVRVADYDLEWRLYVTTSATRPTSAATRALLMLIEEVVAR